MKQFLTILYLFDLPDHATTAPYEDQFQKEDWQKHQTIIHTIQSLGHTVRLIGLFDDIRPLLIECRKHRPDIVFNQIEGFRGKRIHESNITGLIELFDLPCTGSTASTLAVCRNKLFTKRLLTPHRIKTPKSVVFPLNHVQYSLKQLGFPVFVKPLGLEGSDGIAQSSFADSKEACLERVRFLHDSLKTDALVEEYIEGRELYASVIGNHHLRVLPLRELIFKEFPEERPKFATFKAKWDENFRKRWGIDNTFANPLPEGVLKKINHISRTAYKALQLSGYGRLDLRLTADNDIYVIEVNPNPALDIEDELAQSAKKNKMDYKKLLQKIIQLGMQR